MEKSSGIKVPEVGDSMPPRIFRFSIAVLTGQSLYKVQAGG
jgi:hypothetical protein